MTAKKTPAQPPDAPLSPAQQLAAARAMEESANKAAADAAGTVDPAHILAEAEHFIRRFVVLPSEAAYPAVVLWAAATHVHLSAFETFGRLAFMADDYKCGKTRAMDITALLTARPESIADPTGPVVTALISRNNPTLTIDECDTIFGVNGSASAYRTLRGILNIGYKVGANIPRVSKGIPVFNAVYGPVIMAGVGHLPESLATRAIVVRMRRRRPEQPCDMYFPRQHAAMGRAIGLSLGAWAGSVATEVRDSWAEYPAGIQDRDAEVWDSILRMADAAGGEWPARAAAAAVEFVQGQQAEPSLSPAQQLLSDLRDVWPAGQANAGSAALLDSLKAIPGSSYATVWPDGQRAQRELSAQLATFGISPTKVKVGPASVGGYRRMDMAPHWLTLPAAATAAQPATAAPATDSTAAG